MAHVTKITAKSPAKETKAKPSKAKTPKAKVPVSKKPEAKKTAKAAKPVKTTAKKPKISILTPFKAVGSYIKNSWQEIRQVRWPSRKATWKLVFAVFVYTVAFMALIMLLDAGLTLIFNNILG